MGQTKSEPNTGPLEKYGKYLGVINSSNALAFLGDTFDFGRHI